MISNYPYTIKISDKARKYHLEIDWQKGLVVVVPKRWNPKFVQELLEDKRSWIDKHLQKIHREQQIDPQEVINEHNLSTRQIKVNFQREADYWANLINVSYERIFIRTQKSKWGSCSSQGNLNFNLHLAYAPPGVREYVVIHELCHLREPNHSSRFWALVEKYCPDYQIPKRWLRVNGRILSNHVKV